MSLTIIAVIFANLSWGLAPVLAKVGLHGVSEVSFLFIRFGLSTIFLLPFAVQAVRKFFYIRGRDLILGVLAVSVHYYLQVFALKLVPVTWYVLFYALCPIVSLFAMKITISPRLIIVSLTAIVGILVFVNLGQESEVDWFGLGALIASVGTWVLFTRAIRSWQTVMSDIEISGGTSLLSFCIFSFMALIHEGNLLEGWSVQALSSTAFLSLLLPLAFFAYSYSLRRAPSLALLGQYSEPLFGMASAIVILDEKISAQQIYGALLILFALAILLSKKNEAIS